MKNILLITFTSALLLFVGVTNVNAQTKTKGDATAITNEVKVKPVTKAVEPKIANQKVNSETVNKENTNQNDVVAPKNGNSKAVPVKKVLKRVDKKSATATATPVLQTENTKNK